MSGFATTVTARAGQAAGTASLSDGTLLGTRYRIETFLGAGAAGEVYRAVDLAIGSRIAIKVVSAPDRAALAREVALAHKVTHRNVCRTHDLDEVGGYHLITMEYVDGTTLDARLAAGRLPAGAALDIATQIARGLEAAHAEGVIHRDLKPHNVMVETGTGRVVLMDFGIAHAIADSTVAEHGTPAYMAPEVWRGETVDGRADLYALGCVLFQMLAGVRPFVAATSPEWRRCHLDDAPAELRGPRRLARLVRALLAKDPANRPRDASEVLRRLAPRWRTRAAIGAAAAAAATVAVAIALHHRPGWQAEIQARAPLYEENGDGLALSHDGRWIAYDSDRDGTWRVWIEPLAGGDARPATPPGWIVLAPRFTSDDRALIVDHLERMRVLLGSHARFERVPLDGSRPEVIAAGASTVDDCAGTLVIGYDGAAGQPARLVARDRTGERTLALFGGDVHFGHLRCSRDGRAFVVDVVGVDASIQVFLGALDGKPPRQLTHGEPSHRAAFAPDGRSIVYVSGGGRTSQIWELALDGGEPRALVAGEDELADPVIAPDGRTLVYSSDTSALPLASLDLATGVVTKVARPLESIYKAASVCGDRLALASSASVWTKQMQLHVVIVDLARHADRDLGPGLTVAAAPGGDELVYSRLEPDGRSSVLAVGCAGGEPRRIATIRGAVGRLAIGDGVVHMSVRDNATIAWRVPLAGGEPVPDGPPPLELVIPAPAGQHVLALRDGRVSVIAPGHALDDPGAPVLDGDIVAWAPDGGALYYWDGHAIVRHELASGGERVLVRNSTFVGALAPSLDGRTLYYPTVIGHVRREMIVNFADRPRP